MRKTAVEFKHSQLFTGEVNYIANVAVGAGAYAPGTLLATTDGKTWTKASAVALNGNYAVCGEAITLEGSGEVVAYKGGYFNKRIVAEATGAGVITEDAVKILVTKDIYLKETIEQ